MALERIKTFSIEEVEAMVKEDVKNNSCRHCDKNNNHSIVVEGHDVYTTSLRYKTFIEKGYKCVCCGRTGAYYALEKSHGSNLKRAHFNLYSDDDVLMTKDHIWPKSKGGMDCIENMQTMCTICNVNKGSTVPNEYIPSENQKKNKSNRCYIWFGATKFSSMDKAVNVMAHGNKKAFGTVKKHIRESIKNGTPYCGEVWRYGKEI
jgi:5-methylcytosine-specific restriction endonuclease McrA